MLVTAGGLSWLQLVAIARDETLGIRLLLFHLLTTFWRLIHVLVV